MDDRLTQKEMVIGGIAYIAFLAVIFLGAHLLSSLETEVVVHLGVILGILAIIWLMIFAVQITIRR